MRMVVLALAFVSYGVPAHHTISEDRRQSRQYHYYEEQQQVAQGSGAPLANENATLRENSFYTFTEVVLWNYTPIDFNLTMKTCSVGSFDVEPPRTMPNKMIAYFTMTGPEFNSTVHLVLCTVGYATADKKTWFYMEKHDGDQNVTASSSADLQVIVRPDPSPPIPNSFVLLIIPKGPSSALQYRPPKLAPYNVFIKAPHRISNEQQLKGPQASAAPLMKAKPSLEDGENPLSTHVFMQNITPKDFILAAAICNLGAFDIMPQQSIPSGTSSHFSMAARALNDTAQSPACFIQYATVGSKTEFLLWKNAGPNDMGASLSSDISVAVETLHFPPLPNAVSVDIKWIGQRSSLLSRPPKRARANNVFMKASKSGFSVRTI